MSSKRKKNRAHQTVKPVPPSKPIPTSEGIHSVPQLDDADAAFGNIKHLPRMADLPEQFQRARHPFCEVAQQLFFKGGALESHGLRIKAGLDTRGVMRAIRAALCSWEPSHEHKIAGVGFLLDQWCESTRAA